MILTSTALKFTALNGKINPLVLGNITPSPISSTLGFKLVKEMLFQTLQLMDSQ